MLAHSEISKICQLGSTIPIQNELNCFTNGDQWVTGFDKNGARLDWSKAIYMELVEAIDSFPWKWWRGGSKVDLQNFKVEMIDVYHFLLSEFIFNHGKSMTSLLGYLAEKCRAVGNEANVDTVQLCEMMIKEIMHYRHDKDMDRFDNFIALFVLTAAKTFDSADEFFKLYYSKSVLNKFRQLNGYANGTYKKVWNGEEDNVVMGKIMDGIEEVDPAAILSALSREYSKVN